MTYSPSGSVYPRTTKPITTSGILVGSLSNPQFDQEVRDRFTEDYQKAAAQQLAEWRTESRSGLALVLLLDQFPRNMFRGKPQAFATDALAREAGNSSYSGWL